MLPHCHEVFSNPHGYTLAFTLFLGAIVGSLTHCVGMCGPFVIAQASGFKTPEGAQPETWYRRLLLPYHFGRLTTYTILGITTSAISVPLLHIPALRILSSLLLIFAGILFLASAFSQLFPIKYFNINFNLCGTPRWIMKFVVPLLPSHSLWGGYLLGILLGFLPCGLVYAAIAAVAATGNILESAFGMIAFAVGTMPVLMVMSMSGKMLRNKQYSWIKPASAILMACNSIVLFAMAGKGFV